MAKIKENGQGVPKCFPSLGLGLIGLKLACKNSMITKNMDCIICLVKLIHHKDCKKLSFYTGANWILSSCFVRNEKNDRLGTIKRMVRGFIKYRSCFLVFINLPTLNQANILWFVVFYHAKNWDNTQ